MSAMCLLFCGNGSIESHNDKHIMTMERALEGRWKTRDLIIKIKKYENDNSKYKIIVYKDGNAYTYVESKRVITWDNGSQKKYRLYASSTSHSSNLSQNMVISYAETSKPTEIFGMSLGDDSYFVTRIDNQRTSSTKTHSIKENQTTNQTNKVQSNFDGYNNTTNANGNNYQSQAVKIANINATFGWAGEWIYQFSSYGTFRHRDIEFNAYNRIVRDYGVKSGSYYITENENGVKTMHLQYENGKNKTGILRYGSKKASLSIDGKRREEL